MISLPDEQAWCDMTEKRRIAVALCRLQLLALIEEGKHPLSFTRKQGKLVEVRKQAENDLFTIFEYEQKL